MIRFILGSPFNHGLLLHQTSNASGALTVKDLVSRAAPAVAKEDSHQNKEEKDKRDNCFSLCPQCVRASKTSSFASTLYLPSTCPESM